MRATEKGMSIVWKNVIGPLSDFIFMRKTKLKKPANETITRDLITPPSHMYQYIICYPTIAYENT